jgi:MSHA biogenesis protein MshE
MPAQKIHIGQFLLDKKLITQAQLDFAISQQKLSGEKLGRVFVDLKYIEEEELLHLLAQQLHISYVKLKDFQLREEIVNLIPEFYARHFRAIVLNKEAEEYLVGMVDPQDLVAYDEISRLLKSPIKIALIREEELLPAIDMMYRRTAEISGFAEELSIELNKNDYNVTQLGQGLSASDAPVVRLLQSIFEDAVQMNASDIHIEPDENLLRIRQRVDGILHEHVVYEQGVVQALTLRLKLMAGVNITEKRLPQDGRFSIKIKGKNFDVRLSTLPVQFGESVVMRLLNQSAEKLDLSFIGMPGNLLIRLRKILSQPNGLLIITGQTGSGKTTTLYGALTELNQAERKIITVEDPVEYRIERINQVQVQPAIEFTFATALRAMLRQDPDIIMIGELRDQETVAIALRAAMTGHLVLTTLHTNDAMSSALRLIDMGAEPYLVSAVLRGVLAQRLIRRICQNCKHERSLSPQEKAWILDVVGEAYTAFPYHHGYGCTYCHNTGYKGQIGVFELLEWEPALTQALHSMDIKALASIGQKQKTFTPLILSALDLAVQGVTSIYEVMRMTGEGQLMTPELKPLLHLHTEKNSSVD